MPEKIMVVPRKQLLKKDFQGFLPHEGNEHVLEAIKKHAFFRGRDEVEEDTSLKQIIPYVVFIHGTKVFLLRRLGKSGEKRLHNLYSIGIGGHVNEGDDGVEEILNAAMRREFLEEVSYSGRFDPKPLGFINDDSNDVGKVHFGVCYVLNGNSRITVKETDMLEGKLAPVDDLKKYNLESWSSIAAEHVLRAIASKRI
ncbi:MAG: NUDIX domain-containing protein [Candidatus Aenigmarchaeota archaeon]|nr:NUDIX domain-containing protein [Candidatus Aenigmarchaeota archaeon]